MHTRRPAHAGLPLRAAFVLILPSLFFSFLSTFVFTHQMSPNLYFIAIPPIPLKTFCRLGSDSALNTTSSDRTFSCERAAEWWRFNCTFGGGDEDIISSNAQSKINECPSTCQQSSKQLWNRSGIIPFLSLKACSLQPLQSLSPPVSPIPVPEGKHLGHVSASATLQGVLALWGWIRCRVQACKGVGVTLWSELLGYGHQVEKHQVSLNL